MTKILWRFYARRLQVAEYESNTRGKESPEGGLVSAILHVLADKPFYTRYPSGHTGEYKNGVRQAMKWHKLLYGKGNASRGLWHDFAATLISLGFEQQVNRSMCLFVTKRIVFFSTADFHQRRSKADV